VHVHSRAWSALRDLHARGEPIDVAFAEAAFAEVQLSRGLAHDALETAQATVVGGVLPTLERLARDREKKRIAEALDIDSDGSGPENGEVLDTMIERLEDLRRRRRIKHELIESRVALGAYLDQVDGRRQSPATVRGLPIGL